MKDVARAYDIRSTESGRLFDPEPDPELSRFIIVCGAEARCIMNIPHTFCHSGAIVELKD